jgi:hypothetical protein
MIKSCFRIVITLKRYTAYRNFERKINTARAESKVIITAAGKILLTARYPPIASPATLS